MDRLLVPTGMVYLPSTSAGGGDTASPLIYQVMVAPSLAFALRTSPQNSSSPLASVCWLVTFRVTLLSAVLSTSPHREMSCCFSLLPGLRAYSVGSTSRFTLISISLAPAYTAPAIEISL